MSGRGEQRRNINRDVFFGIVEHGESQIDYSASSKSYYTTVGGRYYSPGHVLKRYVGKNVRITINIEELGD